MRIPTKTISVILLTVFGVFLPVAPATHAATESKSACAVSAIQEELITLRDSTEASERGQRELVLSKKLLNEIISCALTELDQTKTRTDGLQKKLTEEEQKLRDTFTAQINEYRTHYAAAQKDLTNETDSLEAVKARARTMLEWREQVYKPGIQRVVTFIFLIESNEAVATAEARFAKIADAVKSVGLAKNEKISALLREAEKNITTAKELRALASTAFYATDPAIEKESEEEDALVAATLRTASLESTTSTPPVADKSPAPAEPNPRTPQEDLGESLNAVRAAYANFIQISSLVKTLIGL